jgi:hypothetical protein
VHLCGNIASELLPLPPISIENASFILVSEATITCENEKITGRQSPSDDEKVLTA